MPFSVFSAPCALLSTLPVTDCLASWPVTTPNRSFNFETLVTDSGLKSWTKQDFSNVGIVRGLRKRNTSTSLKKCSYFWLLDSLPKGSYVVGLILTESLYAGWRYFLCLAGFQLCIVQKPNSIVGTITWLQLQQFITVSLRKPVWHRQLIATITESLLLAFNSLIIVYLVPLHQTLIVFGGSSIASPKSRTWFLWYFIQ